MKRFSSSVVGVSEPEEDLETKRIPMKSHREDKTLSMDSWTWICGGRLMMDI